MTQQQIVQSIIALVSGGFIWETIKFVYPEVKRYFTNRIEARKVLAENIDPILKSSDELVGKINSLARTDFKEIYTQDLASLTDDKRIERIYILYLFSSVWGRISALRTNANFSNLAKFRKGRRFLSFLYSFESKKNRVVSRAIQRTIGDFMISKKDAEIINLYEFSTALNDNEGQIQNMIKPLDQVLKNSNNRRVRQQILLYGVLLQAFCDFFDKNKDATKNRTFYTNKLAPRTKQQISRRIFNTYLPFVKKPDRYS